MPVTYQAVAETFEAESGIVVVHCSDPRYQPYFQEFLQKGLGHKHYALIAVPGGAHFLTLSEYLPKFSWAGWKWTKFLFDLQKATRVILIAHDDCRWYQDLRFGFRPRPIREHQTEDLQAVAREVRTRFAGVRPELYYAKSDGGRVSFEAL